MMQKNLNLITIDQRPLRKSAIHELEAWHDKIELLEIEIQKFHDSDFKLYNDWLRLTLADLQIETNSLIEKYQKLAQFHNWVVFTAEERNISLPYAFFLMAEEDRLFQKGTQEEKDHIEKIRIERTKKINSGIKSEDEDDYDEEETEFDSEPDTDSSEYDHAHSEDDDWLKTEEREIRSMREKFQKELIFFEGLTDKKIAKTMRQFDEGINLIANCVYICSLCYRFDIVERIWGFVPLKIKTHFNADFKKQMGVTLDQYLVNIKNDAQRSSTLEDSDEEFNFKAHFENPFSSPTIEILPENVEAAKIIYRRIMMKVHPDKLSTEFVTVKKSWLDRLWKKIQGAYEKSDVKALQNLNLQVLVTLKKYDELDLTDLRSGSKLLQSELDRLGKSHEETLQHPAWGFSKLKSYKKLEKIVAEPYKNTSKDLKKDIKRLEKMHADLKEFVDTIQAAGGFGRAKKRKPVQRRKKRQTTSSQQTSLF